MDIVLLALFITLLALFFGFSNGFHDASSIVAPVISSRSMRLRSALIMIACFEFLGAYFLGTSVVKTIAHDLVNPDRLGVTVILATILAAIAWNMLTWTMGLPSSSSHALIGALAGATCMVEGIHVINWVKLAEVIAVLLITPAVGFLGGLLITLLNFLLFSSSRPAVANRILKKALVVSSALLALAHGTNDAQKTMGTIVLGLAILYNISPETICFLYTPGHEGMLAVPQWVMISSALALSLGMLTGGKRIIKTLGMKLYKIRPIHAFGAQLSSAIIVYACSLLGFPVSTTIIAAPAIMGAGSAERISIVRWGIAGEILFTWMITIPCTFVMGIILAWVM
ncbi:MAG: inorganic phosphate transporter [Deltaproteobacteria bacterium]|nr:inorganic phosphate transporter [Deltaproteobacteria bacterium]